MTAACCITTSWDDGHPSDFRVAESLTRYGLRGTFYVPKEAQTKTISPAQVRELADSFEVGGHTIDHVVLTETPDDNARRQIAESKSWLEGITGRPCPMFCPPKGKFRRRHLDMIRDAGYAGLRTVELLSLDFPRPAAGMMVMPTTVQAHDSGLAGYTRNTLRRGAVRNLGLLLLHGRSTDWLKLTRSLVTRAVEQGGVFHLWGHSWELDAHGLWGRLEDWLRLMGEFAPHACPETNGQLCDRALRAGSVSDGREKEPSLTLPARTRDAGGGPVKVLVVHNYYQQPGGEDRCLDAEAAMLRANGDQVVQYSADNDAIDGMGRLNLLARTVWSRPAYRDLRELIRAERPAVAHFHNTFPLISPAAYYAARKEGVPVVQTLHNFRLLCPNALFFREGRVCEDCLGKAVPWPGVVHGCYRGSRTATAAVATMLTTHRVLGTWQDAVNVYIALTEASRRKFLAGGLPAERLVVKPNFLDADPGIGEGSGGHAIYVGRLSAEKGLGTLLKAWASLDVPLKIVGDGPLAGPVAEAVAKNPAIQWLNARPPEEVLDLIGRAAVLVLPSECYENFPRVVVEAFAKGTPVIASRLGAMAEIVDDGRTGWQFKAGDAADLAATIRRAWPPATRRGLNEMRQAARAEFEENYTAEANYRALMTIYEKAGAAVGEPVPSSN